MLVFIHLIVALSGVICASWALLRPSSTKIQVGYGLLSLTLASGTALVVITRSPMLPSCLSGLAYCSFVLVALVFARRRLSA